jgi:signal peptidase II
VFISAGFVFFVDQLSKTIVRNTIEPNQPYRGEVFFHFTHQQNRGLIGGSFSGIPFLPYVLPIIAFCLLIYMYRMLSPNHKIQYIAFGAIIGGALGNYFDRIRIQSVTDFLQFHFLFIPFDFPWKYYPAFNIADSGIFLGVAILLFTLKPNEERHDTSTA